MSITKIAGMVGVSPVTVSRALNNPDKLKPETLEKIQKACQEIKFRPRNIVGKTKNVNIIIPPGSLYYQGDGLLINEIVALLYKKNYHAMIMPVNALENMPNILFSPSVAILHQGDDQSRDFIKNNSSAYPFIIINDTNDDLGPEPIIIGSDHAQGARLAINHLLDMGHRKIGYIGLHLNSRGYQERFNEYKNILSEKNIFDESYVFINSEQLLIEGIKRICDQNVSAIFISIPELTAKVIYFLRLFKKEVPKDISIVSVSYSDNFEFLYPPPTSIVQPVQKVASLTADIISQLFEGNGDSIPQNHYVSYKLINRESVLKL